jgi:hypothetical protein
MYERAKEAQVAVHAAKRAVAAAINEASRDPRNADCCRHLTGLNYCLMSCAFQAAEAVNAAQMMDAIRSHEHAVQVGGGIRNAGSERSA